MDTTETQKSAFNLNKGKTSGGKVNSSTRIKKPPKELKSYHETCLKCGLRVSSRAMFCGNCGYVQIKNDLIHESSTSIYDPGDRSVKPWREKSIVAKNHWKSRIKKVKVEKKDPWRPTMKSTRVYKKMVIGVPSVLQDGSTGQKTVEMTAHERMKQYDTGRKLEVRYKGRIWRRAGEQHRRKKGLLQLPNKWSFEGGVSTSDSLSSTFVREVPDEESFPLAIFEVDWMQVAVGSDDGEQEHGVPQEDKNEGEEESPAASEKAMMTIHFSLYQHVMESEDFDLETNKVQRWLRVGYLLEGGPNEDKKPSNGKDLEEDDSAGGQSVGTLKILDFIPNGVAKCMGIKESDWVDLDYIDPKNSFMVEHLQKSLIQIARRVVSRVKDYSTSFDQSSRIIFVDSNNEEVFNYGDEKYDDEEMGNSSAVMGGSYSKSAKLLRKLISKEDQSLAAPEEESSSDYIRRHLAESKDQDNDEEEKSSHNDEDAKGAKSDAKEEAVSENESSTEFIRRHLAEAEAKEEDKQTSYRKDDDEEESSSDFIRRHLAEAGLNDDIEDDNQQEEEKAGDKSIGESKQLDADREAAALYREYQAKVAEERDMNEFVELDDLEIVDTVAQISTPLPLGAYYLNKRINTKVWMSVAWNHDDGIDRSLKIRPKFSTSRSRKNVFDYNAVDVQSSISCSTFDASTHSQPSAVSCYEDMGFLARKPLVESITLKLFPMYYDEMMVQPKIIRFSTWSLAALLEVASVHQQMMACNEVHEFSSEHRLSSLDVSAYVLFCLSKGAIGAHGLCRTLTSFLRYEHTTQGIRVFVNGVDNDFCLSSSPEEMKLQLLENKHACIVIQCLFRKSIANRKFRNLVRKDQRQRHARMNNAAIQIQRIGRGYVERMMVKALLKQIKENKEKARLLAEAEAREKILFCDMNNTSVEVTADCGKSQQEGDQSGAAVELVEMNIHVTDSESRKVTSFYMDQINVSRVWALYLAKFKKSLSFKSITEVFNNLKARKKLLLFMTVHCLELFLSRQNNFMKLSLKNLCQYVSSVIVKVVSARDLVNADAMLGGRTDGLLGGKSDPYVVVRLGKIKFKTKTKKNNLNPEYDEEFTLEWKHPEQSSEEDDTLCLDVMDKDLLSKDDLLGKCVIPLNTIGIPTVEPISVDIPLVDCSHGSLQIEIGNVLESLT
eukprot:CAMPEP_0114445816 /NCGR_PEP_ID=MMETSP0103-20121206/18862_1 /TAXON_ID=37642 ORGANISM="Paraphysomonas imperforata, Strain PA2" /NCGR_SAMPLE_ID=MMETSP0103 /ASSEMBLY_ACC=CAM_ASM_000201 /LENGTH=1169 /DNA_ID=CAMNT_0001617527 /DNA_START=69 /DNA_END=3578 /DNA_ORIENTATION=-